MALTVAGTEVASMLFLHRHSDGVISFALESDDLWLPAFAVRARDLESVFPEVLGQLIRDSFISINAAHRMARGSKGRRGLPAHKQETLRYLCACYCDIDFYRKGLTREEVLVFVRGLVKTGELPAFSAVVESGRGLWLLWLLHDERDSSQAHLGAYDDNRTNHLQLHRKINQKIGQLLSEVGADPAAIDAARYIRVPGSFRSDVEEVVLWEWQDKFSQKVVSYTLGQLADELGISAPVSTTSEKQPWDSGGKCPARRAGFDAANKNKLEAFQLIRRLRNGGISEGMRNNAAFILAACLKWNGRSLNGAVTEVSDFARTCSPPLPNRECLSAVKSAYRVCVRKMSYQWMANELDVTPDEALRISDALRKKFPAAARFGGGLALPGWRESGKRATQRLLRRLEIRKVIQELGVVPSLRMLQKMLRKVGIVVGHVTIMTDLKALEANEGTPPLDTLFSASSL